MFKRHSFKEICKNTLFFITFTNSIAIFNFLKTQLQKSQTQIIAFDCHWKRQLCNCGNLSLLKSVNCFKNAEVDILQATSKSIIDENNSLCCELLNQLLTTVCLVIFRNKCQIRFGHEREEKAKIDTLYQTVPIHVQRYCLHWVHVSDFWYFCCTLLYFFVLTCHKTNYTVGWASSGTFFRRCMLL